MAEGIVLGGKNGARELEKNRYKLLEARDWTLVLRSSKGEIAVSKDYPQNPPYINGVYFEPAPSEGVKGASRIYDPFWQTKWEADKSGKFGPRDYSNQIVALLAAFGDRDERDFGELRKYMKVRKVNDVEQEPVEETHLDANVLLTILQEFDGRELRAKVGVRTERGTQKNVIMSFHIHPDLKKELKEEAQTEAASESAPNEEGGEETSGKGRSRGKRR